MTLGLFGLTFGLYRLLVVSERTSDAGPQLMTRGPVPDGELVHSQHTTQGKDKTTEGKRKSGPSVSQVRCSS